MSPQQSTLIEDFSKGLDLVSSLNTVQPGFTQNAMNFRISEYGGIEKVLGYSAFATLGGAAHELSVYAQRDNTPNVLIAALSTSWQAITSAGSVSNVRTSMTATTNTTFVVHEEKLYGLDPLNNMGTWDGTTLNTYAPGVNTGPPKGIILGIWQNRMWVAKADASGNLTLRVEFSEPPPVSGNFGGETGVWATDNYIELGGSGQSDRIVGGMPTADGLVVFTQASTYLIYDTDGSFRVVDPERGCASRKSLARINDNIYGVTTDGVFSTSGSFPLEIVSRRVDPLFRDEQPTLTDAAGIRWGGTYFLSYQRGDDNNDVTLDITPSLGSIMANEYPAHAWVTSTMSGQEQLYFLDATDLTKIRLAFDGGSFNGDDIQCYYETPFDNLGVEGQLKRLHSLRLVGRGDVYVSVKTDYGSLADSTDRLSFPDLGETGVWDTAVWDETTWNDYVLYEGWARPSARARRISLRFWERGQATYLTRPNLGRSNLGDTELGGAGIYLAEPRFTLSSRIR